MTTSAVLLLVVGLVVLVGGAELLVRGASGLAARLGVAPLVVGLTVVAFGTSAPELAVSLSAAHTGRPDLAIGNAVGSNTFNVLFILGLSAVLRPLVVHRKLVRVDVPIMIGVSALLWLLVRDGRLGRVDGVLLVAGIAAYTAFMVRAARGSGATDGEDRAALPPEARTPSPAVAIVLVAVGLAAAVAGAKLFVGGAVAVAAALGVNEIVIGLTIVAAGTSLPEVATSVVAVVRGQRDIAVGNVVGSNIFNVLAILGLTGASTRDGLAVAPSIIAFDVPVMMAATLACLPIVLTGHEIRRWEGALLLAGYVAYVAYLALDATEHAWRTGYAFAVLWLALPLALLGISASVIAALRPTARRP